MDPSVEPNWNQAIFDVLGLGEGQAGKALSEEFILADAYDPGDKYDPNVGRPEVQPAILHLESGRRFIIFAYEWLQDLSTESTEIPTAADPELERLLREEEEIEARTSFKPEESADGATYPQPEPETVERPEPIQSFTHEPQPVEPPANVPEDFELKVAEHDAQIQAGAPLPTPPEPTPEDE